MVLPFAFVVGFSKGPWSERTFCWICTLLALAGVMVEASRGGFLALVAAMCFMTLRSRHRVRIFAITAVVIVPILLAAPATPLKRLMAPSQSDTGGFDLRTQLWRVGWEMIKAHPIVGVGVGNFMPLVPSYPHGQNLPKAIACNTFIEVTAEQGIVGLAVFLALLFFTWRSLERSYRRALALGRPDLRVIITAVQAGVIAYVVGCLSLSTQYVKFFWLDVFMAVSFTNMLDAYANRLKRSAAQDAPGRRSMNERSYA
jgi:O-antigen ligase